jgi:hypothetical protein
MTQHRLQVRIEKLVVMPASCRCATSAHDRPGCSHAPIRSIRERLFRGLYDEGCFQASGPPTGTSHVRLLNPHYREEDTTSRRFALLEID